jgi:signal transduction histidine kinase
MSLTGSFILNRQVKARTRELRQINHEMEQRILERTAELAVAKDRAESADRLKSAFLATMSHELRTPLNSIIGFTGIMLQGLAGAINQEQTKQLEIVQSSANHLLALINDVLDISKIEAGQLEVMVKCYDLRRSIDKVVAIIRPLAEAKGLKLSAIIASGVRNLVSDQRRVEQVLLNLLNNAVKFTERGSIRLECHIAENAMVTRITDTGIGIRPEDRDQLFKPFSQIDTGLTRSHEGTGLGLAICNKLVEKMGGTIQLETASGPGVYLPSGCP